MWLWKSGFVAISFMMLVSGCSIASPKDSIIQEEEIDDKDIETYEKGYNLPVDEEAGKEVEEECKEVMKMVEKIYINADKGTASNIVLSNDTILQMKEIIKKIKQPVTSPEPYAVMKNHQKMEKFLYACMKGKQGSVVLYELNHNGSMGRMEYCFDGRDMYLLAAGAVWNQKNQPEISYLTYTRMKQWEYTEKGWFCYELCVPEYPEVTETMDGSCMIRVRPLTDEQRKMSEKCVLHLGYQGNNLLCSNWNATHMEALDFNGMYEYLYAMKYGHRFPAEKFPDGIPKDKFESLIMEYLPITPEQIQKYGVFDKQHRTYLWMRLGCTNYTPTFFGTSLPEVTDIRKNDDGTVTLTVEAVCEMIVCNDAVITHELTVRFFKNGRFQYLENKILNDGIRHIPRYQYRISKQKL